ncbi:hypothetical protein JCM6882_007964 [Rhodosporidiobolus microsporus]
MVQLNDTFDRLTVSDRPSSSTGKPTRPRPAASTSSSSSSAVAPLAPSTARLLTFLASLFTPLRLSPSFLPALQSVKSLLFSKDYLRAFGSPGEEGERWREVYVSRWTPARAVVYERVFEECAVAEALGWTSERGDAGLGEEEIEERELGRERERARRRREWKKEGKAPAEVDALEKAADEAEEEAKREAKGKQRAEEEGDAQLEDQNVLMLGAGAGGEVVAFGCVLGSAAEKEGAPARRPRVKVEVVDQGAWGTLLDKMADGMRATWPALSAPLSQSSISNHATATATSPLLRPHPLTVSFSQSDVLAPSSLSPPSSPYRLITILYTLSELLLQSRPSTLRLLRQFSSAAFTAPGTLLLIVESASLALIPLGAEGRTYPLGALLDHALCGAPGKEDEGEWVKVRGEEAKWYRMPSGAEEAYNPPGSGGRIGLENARVVLRLYRRK